MTKTSLGTAKPQSEEARDLQARLYREIGISAVAAALRFTKQPDPGKPCAVQHPLPAVLRSDDLAA